MKHQLTILLFISLLLFAGIAKANTYYISPSGNNSNPGTLASPWHDFDKLTTAGLTAGDIVYFRGGTYRCAKSAGTTDRFAISGVNGSSGNLIKLWAYPGETPLFNYDDVLCTTTAVGLRISSSSYLHFKGLRFTGLAQNPTNNDVWVFLLSGSPNCIIENCTVDNSAMYGFTNSNSNNTLWLNCDAHHLQNPYSPDPYGGSNGFNTGQNGNTSTNVTLRGCRAWWCSDDGFDDYRNTGIDGTTIYENCWAFWNGFIPGTFTPVGDGEGFKLGSEVSSGSNVLKKLTSCLAFENRSAGFNQNTIRPSHPIIFYNCTSYGNTIGFQAFSEGGNIAHILKNNIAYANTQYAENFTLLSNVVQSNNTWNGGVTVTNADFLSVSSAGADGPRQADGSLPNLNYLKLAAGSRLVDAGVNVGLPFSGNAPDIAAFESGNATPVNQPPIANAGSAQIIILPISLTTLNGSSSSDPDGTITAYSWSKISGPSAIMLLPALATTTVTSLSQGIYQFELKVTDNQGAVGRDTVTITVNPVSNQSPVANAGADKTITLPTNNVTLIGSSTDGDGSIASYQWSKITGPTQFTISTATQSQTAINNLVQGVYQFELKVTDNLGAIGRDTIKVTVNAAPNQSPMANAGTDKAITLPTNSVTVAGSGTDADGSIAIYQWSKITGPSQFIIATSNQAQTLISSLVQGTYQFELKVTDNLGAIGKDTINVTVSAAPNQSPVANTGSDKIITLPTNNVTLTGSGTDADGTIAAYQWNKVSGPSQFAIATATQAQTVINNLVQGIYQFELKVTDNLGLVGKDTVIVTVNAAPPINQIPVANAGTDINITLPTNTATLTGSGTDADGTITTYRWTMVAGPTQFTITSRSQAQTGISSLVQGIYQFELQVTDNLGAVGKDTVKVTVNAAPNQLPIANTGTDKTITLPTNTVTVTGGGTDADGTIAAYQWSKVSGPSQFAIATATQAQTTINNLVQGVYQFELKVTDNQGAIGNDTILITVNAAPLPVLNQLPIANAGNDISITLPTNNITLSGGGSDADGSIASYRWTKVTGPSQFRITSRSQAQTTVTNLSQGVYQFELQVTDNQGSIGNDTITVTVSPAPASSNKKPVGNAGQDKKITLPTNTVAVAGTGTDPDGTVTAVQWSQVSGPAQSSIASATQEQTTISNLAEGVYQFELKVTDDQGETGADTIFVIVMAAPNQSPLVNAGNDITITLPTNGTTLIGNGSDPDGTIVSYRWTQVGGPSQFGIASRSQAQTDIYNLIQGIYQFELVITDDLGATGKDTVMVTVNAAPNQPPVANAGFDNNITLPVNSINLVGIGADADGSIVAYQWTKMSGPAQYTIVSPTQPQTVVNNLAQGTYQFELTVTDNRGGTAKDIVIVIVNPAPPPPNQPPVANAGVDKAITLPTNTVALTGNGTDADGTIASYQWNKISGPSQFIITSPMQAQTTINNLVEGVYQFEITVIDNKGAIGKDIVIVTVNPIPNQPPVANAGTDKTITLPINSVTVTGTAKDADGTIVSYQWTEVSGHPQFTIATPTQAQTVIDNLVEGIYRFELKVTDNKGAVGKDTMQITVLKGIANISFGIYPNPATTTLNIKLDAISQPTLSGIHIFDSRGVLIWKEQFTRSQQPMYKQIDLTKYSKGIYFIEIGDDLSRQRLKFVKQ